nr:hypothetical protein [Ktedonosporobacter rubrisoli]
MMDDELAFAEQMQDLETLMRTEQPDIYAIPTHAPGPQGKLP